MPLFLLWLCIGVLTGLLASGLVNKTGAGLVKDIILSAIGAVIAGIAFSLLSAFTVLGDTKSTGFNPYSAVAAFVGAMGMLAIYHMALRRPLSRLRLPRALFKRPLFKRPLFRRRGRSG